MKLSNVSVMNDKPVKNLIPFISGITFQKVLNQSLAHHTVQFSKSCRVSNIYSMPSTTLDTNQASMFFIESGSSRLTSKSERMEDVLKSETEERSFVGLIRRSASLTSSCSSSNRNSTISSSSILSESESLSAFSLPLELELSVMGTVDQCLLDRAQVALDKRNKSLEIGQFSPSRGLLRAKTTRSLDRCRKAVDSDTQIDKQGLFTTTLCSTEL